MTEPVASYGGLAWWENFAEYGFCTRLRVEQLRDFGAALTPFNAFLFLHRPRDPRAAHGRSTWRTRRPWPSSSHATTGVAWVSYAGLPDSP